MAKPKFSPELSQDLGAYLRSLTADELRNLRDSLKQKLTISDFLTFMQDILGYRVDAHHRVWSELLRNHRLAIESSRDHSKTTTFSVAYPLWKAVTNPGTHICIISYSEAQSKKVLFEIKSKTETVPLFFDLIPSRFKPGAWGKSEAHFLNHSSIQAKSFGSSMRGGHYDIVIVDDPLKDRSAIPKDDLVNIFFGVIVPAVKRGGQVVVVGTPMEFGDLFDILEQNKEYMHVKFPAQNDKGEMLWPEMRPREWLEQKKREIPSYWLYAREYLLQRIDPERAAFKEAWIKYYDGKMEKPLSVLMSVDPALTLKGDYTAIVATGTDKDLNTYILETKKLHSDNLYDIVKAIIDVAKGHGCRRLIVEALGFQRLIKYWLLKEMQRIGYWIAIEEIKYHRTSKDQRILTLQPKMESGTLFFRRWHEDLMNELRSFPKAAHDDLVDALSMQVGRWCPPEVFPSTIPEGSFEHVLNTMKEKNLDYRKLLFEDFLPMEAEQTLFVKHDA